MNRLIFPGIPRKKTAAAAALLGLLLIAVTAHAQDLPDTAQAAARRHWWDKYRPDSLVNKKISILPIPVLNSSPETGVRFGLVLQYFLNTGEKKETGRKTRDSYAYLEALYSTRKQTIVESYTQLFTPGEHFFIRNRVGYADNNERIWGFGNHTLPNSVYERVKYARWYWQGSIARQLKNKFFAGINLNFSKTYGVELAVKDTNLLAGQPGEQRSTVVGLGPTLIWDKRDHPLSARRGWFGELSVTYHFKAVSSGFNYTEYLADFRKYFLLRDSSCIALQALGTLTNGTVPWREQVRMGNSTMMRGYFAGRYRGNQYIAAQAEYRKPVHRWVTAAVFASMGQVQYAIKGFTPADMRVAGGAGIRVLVNKAKRIYLRMDYAVSGDKTTGFYFKIGDAF